MVITATPANFNIKAIRIQVPNEEFMYKTTSLKQPPQCKVLLYLTLTIQHNGRLSQEVHNILFTKHLHKVLTSVVDLQYSQLREMLVHYTKLVIKVI